MKLQPVLTVAAVAAVIACGAVHGAWTHRWQISSRILEASSAIDRLPAGIEGWESEDVELPPEQLAQTEAVRAYAKRLTHRPTGASVSVLLLCGRTGPLAVHTPEVCFQGRGKDPMGAPRRVAIKDDTGREWGEFWAADFRPSDRRQQDHVRLFWGWSADGLQWKSPNNPRVTFAGNPVLYKLYVMRNLSELEVRERRERREPPINSDEIAGVLRKFLPEVRQALRSSQRAPRETAGAEVDRQPRAGSGGAG
jgi:hypothetical protein